jgi:hypothetical protein
VFPIFRPKDQPSAIQPVIDELISRMKEEDPDSDDYAKMAHNLKTLLEAKGMEPKPDRVSPNTVAVIAANLTGIAMILVFERANVVTSKSLPFIMKPRT